MRRAWRRVDQIETDADEEEAKRERVRARGIEERAGDVGIDGKVREV